MIKLPSLKGLLAGSITEGVKVIADVVDRFKLTGEEKAAITQAAENAMNAHAEKMEELVLKQQELENADRDSARDMQKAALAQTDIFSKRFTYYLAAFVIIAAFGYGSALLFVEVPQENRRMVEQFNDMFTLTGALMVLSFFYGAAHKIASAKGLRG